MNRITSGGERNPPLTLTGRKQIKAAAAVLRKHGILINLIVAADSRRTVESAEIIKQELNQPAELQCNPIFRERYLGEWNNKPYEFIHPKLANGDTPPNGESQVEFKARFMSGLSQLLSQTQNWPLLVGSRGNARILLEMVNDMEATTFPNGSLLKITLASTAPFKIASIERFE